MTVSAEIRPVGSSSNVKNVDANGFIYGCVKAAGLHPLLAANVPSPEEFQNSPHAPLVFTSSPFVHQVGVQVAGDRGWLPSQTVRPNRCSAVPSRRCRTNASGYGRLTPALKLSHWQQKQLAAAAVA